MANVKGKMKNGKTQADVRPSAHRAIFCPLPFSIFHRHPRRRGNAVLDMALVLPILLCVAFGTIEYGYFFFVKHTLQAAAREGARRAIVSGATTTDVNNAVTNVMTAAGFDSTYYAAPTISPSGWTTAASGTDVMVTINATWGTIGLQPLPDAMGGIAADRNLQGKTVMRKE